MGITPPGKTQLNVYVPQSIDDYVEHITTLTKLSKSDFAHLAFAYFSIHFSTEQIIQMGERMLLFGEEGLVSFNAVDHT